MKLTLLSLTKKQQTFVCLILVIIIILLLFRDCNRKPCPVPQVSEITIDTTTVVTTDTNIIVVSDSMTTIYNELSVKFDDLTGKYRIVLSNLVKAKDSIKILGGDGKPIPDPILYQKTYGDRIYIIKDSFDFGYIDLTHVVLGTLIKTKKTWHLKIPEILKKTTETITTNETNTYPVPTHKSSLWLSGGLTQHQFNIKSIPIGVTYLNKRGWGIGYERHLFLNMNEFTVLYRLR